MKVVVVSESIKRFNMSLSGAVYWHLDIWIRQWQRFGWQLTDFDLECDSCHLFTKWLQLNWVICKIFILEDLCRVWSVWVDNVNVGTCLTFVVFPVWGLRRGGKARSRRGVRRVPRTCWDCWLTCSWGKGSRAVRSSLQNREVRCLLCDLQLG